MFLVAFVLFGEDFFQPVSLFLRVLFVNEAGMMTYYELFPAHVAPQGAHFPETCNIRLWPPLLYCHRLHLLDLFASFRSHFTCPGFPAALSTEVGKIVSDFLAG